MTDAEKLGAEELDRVRREKVLSCEIYEYNF